MAHPYHHALSSAKIFGGKAEDYMALHSWLDATKEMYADFRHRALRHHVEGVALARHYFGEFIINSENEEVTTEEVLFQHIEEDCLELVSIKDWLSEYQLPVWAKDIHLPNQKEQQEMLLAKLAVSQESNSLQELVHFFNTTYSLSENKANMSLLWNSHGIFESERYLGALIKTETGQHIPTRYAAETLVRSIVKRIPTAQEWLKSIPGRDWMIKTKKIHRQFN